jgi:nickel transport protein
MAFFFPSTALAHKVNVFAYVEGDTVIAEAYFNDGAKCRDSVIEVFDNEGQKLLEGKTDIEGRFSFPVPARTDLLIRLTASMGHQAEYTIPASDLPGGAVDETPVLPDVVESPESAPMEEPDDLRSGSIVATDDFEQVVERVVARQMAPIRRALEEAKDKQRFSDIVGGIGYIIGLMGLVLYFRSKQRKN